MPVRTIKRIEIGSEVGTDSYDENKLVLRVSKAIVHGIHLRKGDIFVCEFKNHYNNEQKLITKINESVEVRCGHGNFDWHYKDYYLSEPHYIVLTDSKLMQKYGFLANEYLEIIFKEVKREKELISIFPERMTEDLDFTPK